MTDYSVSPIEGTEDEANVQLDRASADLSTGPSDADGGGLPPAQIVSP